MAALLSAVLSLASLPLARSIATPLSVHVDGVGPPLDSVWLRDHCQECGSFGPKGMGLRNWDAVSSLGTPIADINDSAADVVIVQWNDTKTGRFTKEWLRNHAPGATDESSAPAEVGNVPLSWLRDRQSWTRDTLSLPRMDLRDAHSAAWRLAFYRTLRKHGVVLVDGAPSGTDAAQERAIEQVLPIYDCDYGKVWTTQGFGVAEEDLPKADVGTSWLASRVEGNAQKPLESHTDNAFWQNSAGLIWFHLAETAGSGGETVLIDGLAVVETLRKRDPMAYKTLSEVEVTWSYHGVAQKGHHHAAGPVLRTDPRTGELLQFRWSNKDRDLMHLPADRARAFYDAYQKLSELMRDPTYQYMIPLKPGSFLVLDNWRITHGRKSYTGKRSLKGAYILRDSFDSRQRLLEEAERREELQEHDLARPDVRVSYRRLDEATAPEIQAQGPLWAALVEADALAKQVLNLLRSLDGEHSRFGFQVNVYEHSLQTATLAHRDGASEEAVVVALLHDVGEAVLGANHGETAAAMLRPFVSEESYFVLKYHDLFQGYHYAHHFGIDRNRRDMLKDSVHYAACARFTDLYDQAAFDPSFESLPLSFFEPMVKRIFQREQYGMDPGNPKKAVAWEASALDRQATTTKCKTARAASANST